MDNKYCPDCGTRMDGSVSGKCNPCAIGRGETSVPHPPVKDWRPQNRKLTDAEIKKKYPLYWRRLHGEQK